MPPSNRRKSCFGDWIWRDGRHCNPSGAWDVHGLIHWSCDDWTLIWSSPRRHLGRIPELAVDILGVSYFVHRQSLGHFCVSSSSRSRNGAALASAGLTREWCRLMPETLRAIVGDGSLRPPFINARPIDWIRKTRADSADPEKVEEVDTAALATKTAKPRYNPLVSFRMLFYPEVFLIEIFGSMVFGVFFGVLTVYSTVLADDYGYDDVKIGLCYLYASLSIRVQRGHR